MHRIFFNHSSPFPQTIKIRDTQELHYLKDVLRLKKGSAVELFNGQGTLAQGSILHFNKGEVKITINSQIEGEVTHGYIILACAMPKKSKFETIIEKATELGVAEIVPLQTKRTEVRIKAEQAARKHKRFETVAINAAKQSKRLSIPIIHPVTKFEKALDQLIELSTVIIPSLNEHSQKLINTLEKHKKSPSIAFLIGPEGDFTPQEYASAEEKGCLPVTLGPTVLKVETAALCVCSAANLVLS